VKSRLRIKTKQQPDASWKAWAVGGKLVVYAKTKEVATATVQMFIGDREDDQTRELDATRKDK